ncbi:hypothetical protein LSM04_006617 [Trypanosoma melophagium]|uniref:uncharacterized protein n=1 Tax=Trypanosoma melophagium TaxID=715481 RepID=UPI003519FBE4|nr:hypothetical protein LSM04_006617 [Trypanosoma melophagium]
MEAAATHCDAAPSPSARLLDTTAQWVSAGTAALAAQTRELLSPGGVAALWRSGSAWVGDRLHLESAKEYTAKVSRQVRDTAASVGGSVGSGVKSGADAARKQITPDNKPNVPKKSGEKCACSEKVCVLVLAGVVAAVSIAGYAIYVKKVKSKKERKQV